MSDRTTRARIRSTPVSRSVTERRVAAKLKDIVADGTVLPVLVIHHRELKGTRRTSCDRQVAAHIRTLSESSQTLNKLFDQLVDDTVEYMQTGIDAGLSGSTERPASMSRKPCSMPNAHIRGGFT